MSRIGASQLTSGSSERFVGADRKMAGISPLLDVEDMVHMKSPDWKCVFTYIQMFYRRFELQATQNSKTTVDVNSAGGHTEVDTYTE